MLSKMSWLTSLLVGAVLLFSLPEAQAIPATITVPATPVSPPGTAAVETLRPDRYVLKTINEQYICMKAVQGYNAKTIDNSVWTTYLAPGNQTPPAACIFYFSTALSDGAATPHFFLFSPLVNQNGQRINLSVRANGRFGAGALVAAEETGEAAYFSGPPPSNGSITQNYQIHITGDGKNPSIGLCLGLNPYLNANPGDITDPKSPILYWRDKGAIIPIQCNDRYSSFTALKLIEKAVTPAITVNSASLTPNNTLPVAHS